MRARYSDAVEWIAFNDDTDDLEERDDLMTVTVCLVADVFGKPTAQVRRDVLRVLARSRKAEATDPDRSPRTLHDS